MVKQNEKEMVMDRKISVSHNVAVPKTKIVKQPTQQKTALDVEKTC